MNVQINSKWNSVFKKKHWPLILGIQIMLLSAVIQLFLLNYNGLLVLSWERALESSVALRLTGRTD